MENEERRIRAAITKLICNIYHARSYSLMKHSRLNFQSINQSINQSISQSKNVFVTLTINYNIFKEK